MTRHILASLALAAATAVSAQTYQVVVTTTDGEKKVYNTDNVSQMRFSQTPDYINASYYLGGIYNPRTSNASYVFTVATGLPDSGGDPAAIGDLQLSLSLYGPLSEQAHRAALPEGYYTYGGGKDNWTLNAEQSGMWLRFDEGDEGISSGFIIGGSVDVRHEGSDTEIRAELDFIDGYHLDLRYVGPMTFTVASSGAGSFDEDMDITFDGGVGRAWCNWFNPFVDDAAVDLYTGKFDSNGVQTEGYWLNLDVNMPKDAAHTADWTPVLADGVYTIDYRDAAAFSTYRPFTLNRGSMIDIWGVSSYVGTYLTYLSPDGRLTGAAITEGSVTVSENGSKYVVDFITDNGLKVTGTLNRRPNIVNYVDNSEAPDVPDLDRDVTLNFTPETVCINYIMGDYIVENIDSHILMFVDPSQDKGDYVSIELFNNDTEVADGTYTVNETFADMTILPGFLGYGGDLLFSWYGDLGIVDDEGYNTFMSPLVAGTATISTLTDGNRKVEFNLTTPAGKKVTGSWTGKFHTASEEDAAAKVAKKRASIHPVRRTWGRSLRDAMPATPRSLK